jgi:ribonuclease HI
LIKIYTDGASRGNPGPGGYGVILHYKGHRKELSEGFRLTTNNRMELLAVIKGLEALKKKDLPVQVYSDSSYVVDAINKNWISNWIRKNYKGVKNPDLWQKLVPLLREMKVTFHWVRGHAGHPENERCDELAVAAALQPNLPPDVGYEQNEE